MTTSYDPFAPGGSGVGVRTLRVDDSRRGRQFPYDVWYPETEPGTHPLVVFSHSSGGDRRQSTFLCTHLASHGYVVAAMDHSERVAPELGRREGETPEQRAARVDAWIASRVPDVRVLLDHLLATWSVPELERDAIGIVGHSFGGWTALATPESDRRIRSIVALAPGGSSSPPPGIIPAPLTFEWGRDVPTLYLVAENDTALPLAGMYELYERTRAAKRMVVLRGADHDFPTDGFEPGTEACTREQAHLFTRGLTVAHLDSVLRDHEGARAFWASDWEEQLLRRGLDASGPRGSTLPGQSS